MKKVFVFCSLLLVGCLFPSVSFATSISGLYSDFVDSIDDRYDLLEQQEVLKKLDAKIQKYQQQNLSSNKQDKLKQVQMYNNNQLFEIFVRLNRDNAAQKEREQAELNTLKNTLSQMQHPDSIRNLASSGKKLYVTDKENAFVEGDSIQKIHFKRYYHIDTESLPRLREMDGVIVYSLRDRKYVFVNEYSFEKKIPYSELEGLFEVFITEETNFIETNGQFFSYIFSGTVFFDGLYGAYLSDMDKHGILPGKTLLLRDNSGKYVFVKDYTQKRLISSHIVDGIPDKHVFLSHIADDKRELDYNTDAQFQALKNTSQLLTQGKNKSQKIESVYNWILENTEYSQNLDLNDSKIFSGIDTYKNGEGVCSGYVKLASYMLLFGGVSDVEVIRGNVIDAQDFPQIGHAWLRIEDRYYDPTFDDPIGLEETRQKDEYIYFSLPKDLIYTNRFDYEDTPEIYKKLPIERRYDIVDKNLYDIASKYPKSEYVILEKAHFLRENNLPYNTTITPSILSKIVPVYPVNNTNFSFTKDGKTYRIKNINFYVLTDESTESILESIHYDMDNVYVFDWEKQDGTREYRISYDVDF